MHEANVTRDRGLANIMRTHAPAYTHMYIYIYSYKLGASHTRTRACDCGQLRNALRLHLCFIWGAAGSVSPLRGCRRSLGTQSAGAWSALARARTPPTTYSATPHDGNDGQH
jgi:hypothetical protein